MKQLSFLLLLGLLLGACDDFLDVSPRDELAKQDALGTINGVRAAMVAAYHGLTFQEHYRQIYPLYPEIAGNMVMSQNAVGGGDIAGSQNVGIVTWRDIINFSQTPLYENSVGGSLYAQLYRMINRCNDLIAFIPQLTEGSAEERTSLLGEAHALRAIAYLSLLNVYSQHYTFTSDARHAGVPLVTRSLSTSAQPPRASVGEVYALMIADLSFAAENIGPASQRSSKPIWLSSCAAEALLARIEAYRENWPAVIEHSSGVINNCAVALSSGQSYLSGWANVNLSETIFYVDLQEYLSDDGSEANISGHSLVIGAGNQQPVCRVSQDLMRLFPPGDLRLNLYTDNGLGDTLCAKYPLRPNYIANFPMLRLSELYLLRAEAYAETGNTMQALEDLNRIYLRANPGANPLNLSGPALLQEIMLERRRELAFEGHLLFDLARKKQPIVRTDCTGSNCSLTYPDYRYVLPLPADALIHNPALIQNDGY